MESIFEPLREMILDYDVFCRVAVALDWISVEERHEEFRHYPLGAEFEVYEFPADYRIGCHIADVYARTVLAGMAFHEEWDRDFWNISQAERKRCLTEGRWLYENYARLREPRFSKRDWGYLEKEIRYFAEYHGMSASGQRRYLDCFRSAEVIELGGDYASDALYWAIRGNALLVVSCGCWD